MQICFIRSGLKRSSPFFPTTGKKMKYLLDNSVLFLSNPTDNGESRVKNLTRSEQEPGVWRFDWLPPWSVDTGDCIKHYVVSAAGYKENVNTTWYILDTKLIPGPVGSVKVAAVIYNGTGPPAKGIQSEITISKFQCTLPVYCLGYGAVSGKEFFIKQTKQYYNGILL